MKLIDVFNFSHEPIELLEMRLRIVYPHVDLICINENAVTYTCLLYTSPSPRDQRGSRMPSSA